MRAGFHDPLFFLERRGGVEAVAERQLQAKPRGVASEASDGAAKESASCVVCVFWNSVTALCFE